MADRFEEIRARLDDATPGPWEWDWSTLGSDIAEVAEPSLSCGSYCLGGTARIDIKAADAQFIANAPEDIAWLLDQVLLLKQERDIAAKQAAVTRERLAKAYFEGHERGFWNGRLSQMSIPYDAPKPEIGINDAKASNPYR